MKRDRIDALLVIRGLCDSREQAKRLILAGEVRSGDRIIDKPSTQLFPDAPLQIKEKQRYVGRGGLKLEGALDQFQIDPTGWICLDVGASTGGFTDCLLQRGASRVYAVDVGHDQLDWKIRSDPRVIVREKYNFRQAQPQDFPEQMLLAVVDVSFISLTLILPPVLSLLSADGMAVVLIKPQFESRREDVGKGGVVRDPAIHQQALNKVRAWVESDGRLRWAGVMDSPITGMSGNREFLAWLVR